jgi:hypothetical protein
VLLLDLGDIGVGTREPYGQLPAETKRGVVPPVKRDRHHRKIGPLRNCAATSRAATAGVMLPLSTATILARRQ